MSTRPTLDRIKETLFNMLHPYLPDARFLDLFSGSGGIGIEALSRGASFCSFLDSDRDCFQCISENLAFTRFTDSSEVILADCRSGLKNMENRGAEPFDIVFMDPPYDSGLEEAIIPYLLSSKLIRESTILILEASMKKDLSFLDSLPVTILKKKEYKTNQHIWFKRKV